MNIATLAMTCPPKSKNVARLLGLFAHCAHCEAGAVRGQPQMESPCTPFRNTRNALFAVGGTTSKVVGRPSSFDLDAPCAPIQKGKHRPPKPQTHPAPVPHPTFPP